MDVITLAMAKPKKIDLMKYAMVIGLSAIDGGSAATEPLTIPEV